MLTNRMFRYDSWDVFVEHAVTRFTEQYQSRVAANPHYNLIFCLSGSVTYWVEGVPYTFSEGDALLLGYAESYFFQAQAGARFERVAVLFERELAERVDPDGTLLSPFNDRQFGYGNVLHASDFPDGLWKLALSHLVEPGEADPGVQVRTYAICLLQQVAAAYRRGVRNKAEKPVQSQAAKVIKYVNAHLYQLDSVEQVAERFHISRSHLFHLFKDATGSSVWEYVTTKRLLAAREFLMTGKTPAEVCDTCGFRDYTNFFRAYKRQFGESPRQTGSRKHPLWNRGEHTEEKETET